MIRRPTSPGPKERGQPKASVVRPAAAHPFVPELGGRWGYVPADWPIRAVRYQPALSHANPILCHSQLSFPEPLRFETHEGVELGIVLSGRQGRIFADTTFVAEPGHVWLAAAWEPHGWQVLEQRTRAIVFIFLPEFLGGEILGGIPWVNLFSIPASQRPRVTSPRLAAKVLALAEDMREEVEERALGWTDAVRHGLARLLLLLRRAWDPPSGIIVPGPVYARSLHRVMPAVANLYGVPNRRISLQEAARACGLSPSRFRQVFRETIGCSFGQFCLRARIAYVAHQLLISDRRIADLAMQAGFVDASHLHRTFVKHYGMTPAAYRRRFAGGHR